MKSNSSLPPKSSPPSSLFRKILKVVLILGTTVGVLCVAALIFVVMKFFPSPGEIAGNLKSQTTTETESSQLSGSSSQTSESTTSSASDNQTAKGADGSGSNDEIKKETFQKILNIMDEDPRDLRVCQNLGSSSFVTAQKENPEQVQIDSLLGTRDDSFAEAVRFPLRAILQDQYVSSLFREISELDEKNLNDQERKGLLEKIGFYSKIAMTMGHLYQRKSEFEALGNRATHLGLIAKMAVLKPELVKDSTVRKFCEDLQGSLAQQEVVDLHAERKEILNLIRYAGLTPEELDFDPNQYIKLNLKQTEDEFKIELNDRATEEDSAQL